MSIDKNIIGNLKCNRCGCTIDPTRWEFKADHLTINISASAGLPSDLNMNDRIHSSIIKLDAQKGTLAVGGMDHGYHLCWGCYRDLLRGIGNFLTTKIKIDE